MDTKKEVISVLKGALKELGFSGVEPKLEHPALRQAQGKLDHGDYSSNVAMAIFQKVPRVARVSRVPQEWKTPLELAEAIAQILNSKFKIQSIERIEIAPPGFINFWLSKEAFGKELEQALKEGERYGRRPGRASDPGGPLARRTSSPEGRSNLGVGRKVIVEFAHPNTHKLFHIGHLRNITLGESISRLSESQQIKVIRANYQGDIGLHIAKALWGIKQLGFKRLESLDEKIKFLAKAYVSGNEGYEGNPSASSGLGGGAKKEIEEINKRLYEGDTELMKLWKETRKWSLEYFDRIYKRVDTRFDRLYFESEAAEPGQKLVLDNLGGVFKKDQGAVIFPGEDYELHTRVFINSRGLPTYEAKDIGLAEFQLKEFSPDKIVHVVGPEQKGYFEVVFKAIEMVFPELKEKEYHLMYGWVRLKEGKMSSRKGDVVEGEWLLDETKKRLLAKYEMPEDVAEKVAVGAVKYSMLRLHPLSEIAFDIDESIRLDGDSGPYLQYTHARCRSVLQKVTRNSLTRDSLNLKQVTMLRDNELQPEELAILRHFYKFPEIVQEAAEKFSPNLLCNFLFELAQRYNAFYNKHRILDRIVKGKKQKAKRNGKNEPFTYHFSPITSFRLALTQVTGNILKTGLELLGIEAPERM